jgi:hypothetical protein
MEARVAFNLLLDRFPDLHVDPAVPPTFMAAPDTTGVTSFVVRTSST